MRLLAHVPRSISDRRHFVAIAHGAMRQALAEQARREGALKRPPVGQARRLGTELADLTEESDSFVDLGLAIDKLSTLDPRQAAICRLHLFADYRLEDCGQALGISTSTVKREWKGARLWLRRELKDYFDGE